MPGTLCSVRKPPHRKTVGIEIECFVKEEIYSKVSSRHNGFWYCGYDGSLHGRPWFHEGVEMVSQPLSVPWMHRELVKLGKLLGEYKVNESCGIHVHVSNQWFTPCRASAVRKWIASLDKFDIEELFGRTHNTYCDPTASRHDRYGAINTTNTHTVEVRSFCSGDVHWAKWCVDFTVYLVENAKHLNMPAALAFKQLWNMENPRP